VLGPGVDTTIKRGAQTGKDLRACRLFAPEMTLTRLVQPLTVRVDFGHEMSYTFARGSHCAHYRHPAPGSGVSELKGCPENAEGIISARFICFVDHNNIADLKQTRFYCLYPIAKTGCLDDNHGFCKRGNVCPVLTGPDCFNQNDRESDRVQEVDQAGRCPREPSLPASARHAAYVHSVIQMRAYHANAITQNRTTCQRT